MKKYEIKDIQLFCTEMGPNGTSELLLVDSNGEVINVLDEALFGATSKFGANEGVYAETCGGYAGQIHGAAYLNYDGDSVINVSNLDSYDCDCEVCEELGYEKSTCEQKDWDMIEYMDEVYDGEKLYWVEFYALERLAACSPFNADGFERILEFLKAHIKEDDILKELEPDQMQQYLMMCNAIGK